jgi:hypothetical protein
VVLDGFVCRVFIFGENRDLVERKLEILLGKIHESGGIWANLWNLKVSR